MTPAPAAPPKAGSCRSLHLDHDDDDSDDVGAVLVCGGEHVREHFGSVLACQPAYLELPLFISSGNYRRHDEFDPACNPALRAYNSDAPLITEAGAVTRPMMAAAAVWQGLLPRLLLDRQAIDTVGNFTRMAPLLR